MVLFKESHDLIDLEHSLVHDLITITVNIILSTTEESFGIYNIMMMNKYEHESSSEIEHGIQQRTRLKS